MKLFFLYILVTCLVLAGGISRLALADGDYDFYKKYGHSNKTWNQEVEAGFAAYDKQDCDGTITHLQEAIKLQAQDALIYYKMAVCTELKGSPYTALQYYQLAQEKLQTLPAVHRYQQDIYENYGRALLKSDKKKEALPYLSRAAAVGSPSFALFYMVGSLSAENGDWGAAVDYYKKAIAQDTTGIDPKLLSQIYFQVGRSFYDAKDYQQALLQLDRAAQLDPDNVQAQNLRGTVATLVQQKSMGEMLDGLSQKGTTGPGTQTSPTVPSTGPVPVTTTPGSTTPGTTTGASNLPPAAAKLPPLNPPSNPPAPAPAPATVPIPESGPTTPSLPQAAPAAPQPATPK
jgi:tetratricopeptide (TPR) repeat protein